MSNEARDQQLYRYPNSGVLRNKLDLRDGEALAHAEARLVENRADQGVPRGNFDQAHLCSIHHHLFQDVYEWAGQIRQTIINKDSGSGEKDDGLFHHPSMIEAGLTDLHKRLSDQQFLRGLSADQFANEAAEYIGDLNRLHPFREGNGRTQLQYLKQLGVHAGYDIDLTQFDRASWVQASIEANGFQTDRMAECIRRGIGGNTQVLDIDEVKREAQERLQKQRQDRSQRQDNGQGEDI